MKCPNCEQEGDKFSTGLSGGLYQCPICEWNWTEWQQEKIQFYKDACIKGNHDVEQILGKVLGYPWYKDDQKNFPGATEADGVCVGEHVAQSIAMEAAHMLTKLLKQENATLREEIETWKQAFDDGSEHHRVEQMEMDTLKRKEGSYETLQRNR
jgi:hypothetical protein